MSELLTLIEKLEAAEGGSSRLDVEILEGFGWEYSYELSPHGYWSPPAWWASAGQDPVPSPTTSLDAALALVRHQSPLRGPVTLIMMGSAEAYLESSDPCGPSVKAFGNSPPLALCIALLRAFSMEGEQDG